MQPWRRGRLACDSYNLKKNRNKFGENRLLAVLSVRPLRGQKSFNRSSLMGVMEIVVIAVVVFLVWHGLRVKKNKSRKDAGD